ncbi:hypothetical protein OG21DRAFT_650695 [Imleria badia]|nr:hypothetical protein OG21DRAFT_650695 [Imleria badia]
MGCCGSPLPQVFRVPNFRHPCHRNTRSGGDRGALIRIALAVFHRGQLSRNTFAGGESYGRCHARTTLVLTVICSSYLCFEFIENTATTLWEVFSAALIRVGTALVRAIFGRSVRFHYEATPSRPTDLEPAFGSQYPDCLQNVNIKYHFPELGAVYGLDDPLVEARGAGTLGESHLSLPVKFHLVITRDAGHAAQVPRLIGNSRRKRTHAPCLNFKHVNSE